MEDKKCCLKGYIINYMKIAVKKRIKRNRRKYHKLILIGTLLFLFYILILEKNFFEKIVKNFSKILFMFKNRKILESEKALQRNNILFTPELKKKMFLNGKKYIDKCLSENNVIKEYKGVVKPIISTIIPVYNCEKTINAAISSIQNQNFTDFEIILINDFSKDNTSEILEELKDKDLRIRIVKNKKNMGTLYSRSIGTLISKGEYIFPLDNDDMFFSEDIFDFILKIARESYLDIVGFRGVQIGNIKDNMNLIRDLYYYQRPDNLIIRQPKLSTWFITINGKFGFHDVTLWCKCIKTKIYKETIISLGLERYSKFMSWAEDTSVNVILFNIAESYTFVNKYGIVHLENISTASYTQPIRIKFFGLLFLLDVLFDFSKKETKNYAVLFAYQIKRLYGINKFVLDDNVIYYKSIIQKIFNNQYITNENKDKIKKDFNFFFT